VAVNESVMTLGTASGVLSLLSNAGDYGLFVGVKNNTGDAWLQAGRKDGTASAYNILLNPSGGNVGIGTTGPGYKLDVRGAPTGGDSQAAFVSNSGTNVSYGGILALNSAGRGLYINVGDASGSTGYYTHPGDATIGATANAKLHLRAGATDTGLTIDTAGNVGIGTTNPGAQLDLSTDNARKLTTTTWSTGSDIRIKTNIESIGDALGIISRVRPVKFNYTPEFLAAHPSVNDTFYYNFIAQEYREVFPNSVSTSTDGLLYLNSSNMIPYAIAGIKELASTTLALQSQMSLLSAAMASNFGTGTATSTLQAQGGTINLSILNNDLNLNGFSILNVKSISGMNGLWSIDSDGNITAKSVNTQALTINGVASGVTVYDRGTTQPKCIYIEGGVIKTSDGACGATVNSGTVAVIETTPTQSPPYQGGEEEGVSSSATTTPTTATTTPISETIPSPTEPILTATSTPMIETTSEPVIVSTTTILTATTTP
jgi:hypothetical protein